MKAFALLTASALALAACSSEPAAPTRQAISEISVNTDLTSVGNPSAVEYWDNLSADLETALANQFVNDISSDGARIEVDVDELSLAESYSEGFGQNSTLSGRVTVTDMRDAPLGTYNVSASMAQAQAVEPGAQPSTDSAAFYQALVQAFAQGVDQTINSGTAP